MRLIGLAVVLALSLAPLGADAQQAGEVPRVGYISPGSSSDPFRLRRFEAFRQGLRELGYVEGRNIALEPRWAEGKYDRYPALAADLVRLKVHVIVAVGGRATQVAQQATKTTPIIMSVVIDPFGNGLVSSLARPGGNVTGLTVMASDLVGKQFELLRQAVPEVSRVALLWNPSQSWGRTAVAGGRGALGVRLQTLGARDPQEIDSAFADEGAGGRARGPSGRHLWESAQANRRPCREVALAVGSRRSSNWSLISRPPRPSASRSRRLCCCARTA